MVPGKTWVRENFARSRNLGSVCDRFRFRVILRLECFFKSRSRILKPGSRSLRREVVISTGGLAFKGIVLICPGQMLNSWGTMHCSGLQSISDDGRSFSMSLQTVFQFC